MRVYKKFKIVQKNRCALLKNKTFLETITICVLETWEMQ